jgi:hypothetical protein
LTGAEPSVLSFNPNPAWIGNEVTIEGTGFGSSAGVLEFQGKPVSPAAIQRWDQERVIFKILPDMGYGYGSLELKTAGAKSAKACLGILRAPQVVGRMQQGHYFSCSARVGDNVWIFSGLNDMGPTKMVERYNLKTNESLIDPQWDIPQAVVGAGAAAIGKKIYVVGGSNQGKTEFYNLLQIFDTTSGRWSQGKPLPRPLRGANVIAHQGKIYVFGGSEKGYPYVLKTTFVYNPAMDAWSEKANLPVATTFAAGALAGSGKVWIMGGLWTDVGAFNNLEHDTVQVYDITTNTWRLFPSLLKPRGGAVGIYFQGNVHCLHGSAPIPDIARYDGEVFRDGAWHNAFMSGLRLYGLMGAVLGNKVFLFGGKSAFTDGPNRDVWSFSGS